VEQALQSLVDDEFLVMGDDRTYALNDRRREEIRALLG